MDSFIDTVAAICDEVAASRGSDRKIQLSFDEWNVEVRVQDPEHDWAVAPRLSEDVHSVDDAVVIGGLLISLLRHSDRVGIACFAQLVNVMALIRAEAGVSWRQPSFFPFALTAAHARGEVLECAIDSSATVNSAVLGSIDPLDAVVTRDPATGSISVFAVNRGIDDEVALSVALPFTERLRVVEQLVLSDQDGDATNTVAHPNRVVPRHSAEHSLESGELRATLPPASWTIVRLEAY